MANVTVGTGYILRTDLMDLAGFWDLPKVSSSATSYAVDAGDNFVADFTIGNLTFNTAGKPASGTITAIEERLNGEIACRIANLQVSVPQFYQISAAGQNSVAISTMFGGDDSFSGSGFDDYIESYAGHDWVFGGAGKDTINGGDGNDHLYGQSANGGLDDADVINGGEGSDYIQGNAGDDTLDGGNGSDRINGGNGADSITGGNGNDVINGNAGNDRIDGGTGEDSIRGGQGDDTISGGNGDDVLIGDLGNDVLVGGQGFDTMTGGGGADTFRFAGTDAPAATGVTRLSLISDFEHLTDKLALGFVPTYVATGTAATIADARVSAQALMTAHSGTMEVSAVQVGGDTMLFWGAAGADLISSGVRLAGVQATIVTTADFV